MNKFAKLDKELTKISLAYIAKDRKRKYDERIKSIEDNPKEWQAYLNMDFEHEIDQKG